MLFVLFGSCSQLILLVDRGCRQLAAACGQKALMQFAFENETADGKHSVNKHRAFIRGSFLDNFWMYFEF